MRIGPDGKYRAESSGGELLHVTHNGEDFAIKIYDKTESKYKRRRHYYDFSRLSSRFAAAVRM